jgi:hypothetical protein
MNAEARKERRILPDIPDLKSTKCKTINSVKK